jgi:hypothetical protein
MYDAIEGKEVKSTIIWRDGRVRFAGMVIAAILDVSPPSVSGATASLPIAFSVRAPRSKPKSCPIKRGNGSARQEP